jgi:hypothetical protein
MACSGTALLLYLEVRRLQRAVGFNKKEVDGFLIN